MSILKGRLPDYLLADYKAHSKKIVAAVKAKFGSTANSVESSKKLTAMIKDFRAGCGDINYKAKLIYKFIDNFPEDKIKKHKRPLPGKILDESIRAKMRQRINEVYGTQVNFCNIHQYKIKYVEAVLSGKIMQITGKVREMASHLSIVL